MIPSDTKITIPAGVLQDLIWNIELNFAGAEEESAAIIAALKQCNTLQKYLDALYPETKVTESFSFDDLANVTYVNFVTRKWY